MKNNQNNLGIYIHVPFCAKKCGYCDFYSCTGSTESQREAYTRQLCRHLEQAASACSDAAAVYTIYIGGGTPSVLGGAQLARVLACARQHFPVLPHAEITIESNPDSMSEQFLHAVRAAGANRLSMGVQSAHDDELARLGRLHTFEQACRAFTRARAAGFENISADLMYALPAQTTERLAQSIDALLALSPEHVSCYGLTLEPHTPLGRQNPVLPEEDTQADMYALLCEKLARAGFEHYEISNFAKPGYASRHNSRYWKQLPYLGLGPGAHGDVHGIRYAIPSDLDAWLNDQAQPVIEDPELDRAAEYVMLSLRTSDGWDANFYQAQFQRDPKKIFAALSQVPQTYLIKSDSKIRLTEAGFLVSNVIIGMALDGVN